MTTTLRTNHSSDGRFTSGHSSMQDSAFEASVDQVRLVRPSSGQNSSMNGVVSSEIGNGINIAACGGSGMPIRFPSFLQDCNESGDEGSDCGSDAEVELSDFCWQSQDLTSQPSQPAPLHNCSTMSSSISPKSDKKF